jgi:hypothetical protein
MHARTSLLALAALTTPTLADGPLQGTATWLYDVTTQNGDAIVEPGETATITLSLLMEPTGGEVKAAFIGYAHFDVLDAGGADTGAVTGWEIHNMLDQLKGDTTTTDGVSLFNVTAQQGLTFDQFFTDDNPVEVITYEWLPSTYEPRTVHYETVSDTIHAPHTVIVYEYFGGDDVDVVTYPLSEAAITVAVIPTPPTLALLLLATPRRRRAHRPTPLLKSQISNLPS